jgi:hypothetical protein
MGALPRVVAVKPSAVLPAETRVWCKEIASTSVFFAAKMPKHVQSVELGMSDRFQPACQAEQDANTAHSMRALQTL